MAFACAAIRRCHDSAGTPGSVAQVYSQLITTRASSRWKSVKRITITAMLTPR